MLKKHVLNRVFIPVYLGDKMEISVILALRGRFWLEQTLWCIWLQTLAELPILQRGKEIRSIRIIESGSMWFRPRASINAGV
jgi:hypothetical protein